MAHTADDLIAFWLDEVGPEGWYGGGEALDRTIRERYHDLWSDGAAGKLEHWMHAPRNMAALIILLDQFPRNMFREDARAFSTDKQALCLAKRAIRLGFDRQVGPDLRAFVYLPLMHSEVLADQDMSVRMFKIGMANESNLLHARAHRKVIRDFGRFPYRNAALGRRSTTAEVAYLRDGAYGLTMRQVSETHQQAG